MLIWVKSSPYSRARVAKLLCFSLLHVPTQCPRHCICPFWLIGTVIFPEYEISSDSQMPCIWCHGVLPYSYSLVFGQRLKEILPKFLIPQIAATPELLNTNSISSARQDPTLQCLVPCTRICKVTPGRRQRCMLSLLCIFSFYPQSQVCFPFSTLK